MADRPVLARGIECLKYDENAVPVLGCEPHLVLRQQLNSTLQEVDTVFLLLDPRLKAGIEVPGQLHARAWAHSERLDEPRYSLRNVVCHVVLFDVDTNPSRRWDEASAMRANPESAETLISCAKPLRLAIVWRRGSSVDAFECGQDRPGSWRVSLRRSERSGGARAREGSLTRDGLQVHGGIERLVAEEHELWERESGGTATEADRRILGLLRRRQPQRRAGAARRGRGALSANAFETPSNSRI